MFNEPNREEQAERTIAYTFLCFEREKGIDAERACQHVLHLSQEQGTFQKKTGLPVNGYQYFISLPVHEMY